MNLLFVAPPDVRVDAESIDPIGAPLGALADELVRQGHSVTLWATPGSRSLALCRSVALPARAGSAERERYARLQVVAALGSAADFDAIHLIGVDAPTELFDLYSRPLFRTVVTPDAAGGGRMVVSSWALRRHYAGKQGTTVSAVIYPGIDVAECPFSDEAEGYLVFTGPLTSARGLDAALLAAYRSERTLLLIGPRPADSARFEEITSPFLQAGIAEYLGDLPAEERRRVVSRAAALLLPHCGAAIDYSGVEALACGTPVVTLDGGAARELVVHGESGIVAARAVDLAAAVDQVDLIGRRNCRRRAERCFDVRDTAAAYVALADMELPAVAGDLHPELEALDPRTPLAVA